MAKFIKVKNVQNEETILLNISIIQSVHVNNHIENANTEIKLLKNVNNCNSFFVAETLEQVEAMCNS